MAINPSSIFVSDPDSPGGSTSPAAKPSSKSVKNPIENAPQEMKAKPTTQVQSSKMGSSNKPPETLDKQQASSIVKSAKSSASGIGSKVEKFLKGLVKSNYEIPGYEDEATPQSAKGKSKGKEREVTSESLEPPKLAEKKELNKAVVDAAMLKLMGSIKKGRDLLTFKGVFEELKANGHNAEAAKCVELLLESLQGQAKTYQSISKEHPEFSRNDYDTCIHYLELTFDNYRKLFSTKDLPHHGLGQTGLAKTGIEHVITNLSEKGKLVDKTTNQEIRCIVCGCTKALRFGHEHHLGIYKDNKNDLTFQVRDQISQMKKASGPARCTFIVDQRGHFTPIFLEKGADGKFRVIVTDSTGNNNAYLPDILKDLNEAFAASGVKNKASIYISDVKRQIDPTNCGVFAIRDVAKMSQNASSLFQSISQLNENALETNGNVNIFSNLPSEMMKTAPLSQVRNRPELTAFTQKHTARALIDKYDEEHDTYTPTVKDINTKIASAYLKYERYLLSKLITES